MTLVPCEACARHIDSSEASCPFCATQRTQPAAARPAPRSRLGRAALFAFSTLVGASAVNCGADDDSTTGQTGSGGSAGSGTGGSAGSATGGSGGSGAGGSGGTSTGGNAGAGGTAGAGGMASGGSAGDDGGVGPVYGAPALDAGKPDALIKDDGGIQPMYGAPP